MRIKQFVLFLIATILCATQAMAAFTPGTYYLQTASGTYIDALAVNSNNPGAKFQSSSATAFTFTAVDGGYTIQNASNNNYLLYSTDKNWDTKMSASASETNYAGVWSVAEDASGKISISRQYNSTTYYLGNGNTNAGTGVYSGQGSAVWYTLEPTYVVVGAGTTGTLSGYNVPAGKSFTMTMEVENDGSSYNQWGSSILATGTNAFPEKSTVNTGFQLYLQSSTNGGKLDLVAAGKDNILSNIAYNESFTLVMTYDNGSLHVVATDAGGNSSETTVSTTLAEITSFAYGLPVGINIKSLRVTILEDAIDVDDDWHTLKTNALTSGSSFYWYASSSTATELGQTTAAPTASNLDLYLWKIQGNDTDGYTLVNKATGKYITDPTSIAANGNSIVRLTDNASRYFYTNDRSFHLASPNEGYFLASYSSDYNTVRLYNSSTYAGSIITISAPYEEQTYTVNVSGGNGNGGVIYAEQNYAHNSNIVSYVDITTGVLSPIPVAGYQANLTMEGTVITVTYTANQVVDNPQAISDLLNRIGGAGTSDKFVTRLDEGLFANGQDKFIIGNQGGKPYIQGSSMTAIATGINWYLNHDAHINISWNQLTADIAGASLPAATAVEKTCDADYRYYLNYCTFGYSMTTWTWGRWQQEIDWMALHGINMPLQIIGLEEVWRKVLVQYNYTDDEAKAFAAGPAFTAWWGMNNLEGWGGTTDDAWFARQAKLGKDICDRMKELGMQPVLPGFAAIVPHDFTKKNPAYASESQGNWGGSFVRPWIMDPSGAKFSEVAEKYYKALEEVLGTSRYYSMDPFHEGGAISSGKYAEGYKAIYDAMNDNCGSDTKWVIQQWQWAGNQKTSLTAVPAGRLIVLDLFADGQPAFDSYNGYAPQEAVFSTIPNFGGRSGFMGRLDNMASNYFTYKGKYSTLKGIGAAPEAIESVPVVYDLLFELPWMGTAPNVTDWVADYATNRYGTANTNAQKAWENIHQSAMAFGADAIQGPIEDVWAARPNLDATPASKWGKTIGNGNVSGIYTTERRQKLISAIYDLVGESTTLSGSNYQYDIIEAGGQVMADYAYDLLLGIKAAKTANNETLFNQRKQAFLDLILGMDDFKGTHQMFRLGNWTQTARDAAAEVQGATTATSDWYELDNARTIITTWGDKGPSEWGLRDYSYRSWQGLLKDYYYPRWEYYFNNNCAAPSAGWFYSEWNWAHELQGEWGASAKGTQMKSERTYYTPTPEGNTVEEANKLLQKYILPIKLNDESIKYVYRALETDLTSAITVESEQGATIEMPIIGVTNIDGTTVTAQLKIDGTLCDGLTIPSITEEGSHTAEYIVSDGTVIKFTLNVKKMSDDAYFYKGEGAVHAFDIRDISAWSALKKQYPWTITMEVETDGLKNYNASGSVVLADGTDAISNKQFQLLMAADGNLKIVLGGTASTGISCKKNFMLTLKYNGTKLYLYAKGKDANGNDKEFGANDGAYYTYNVNDFTHLSCALPEGVNIKTLTVTSEEPLNFAPDPSTLQSGDNYVDGNGEVQLLKAKYYITNTDSEGNAKYDYVPEGKAWQMVMDVTHDAGQKNSFNQWGSCILASEIDPINTYYWNNFQIYEHAVSKGTLNFKSNKGDGNDHIIAQGHKIGDSTNGYADYRIIIRYDGGNVYLIRTIILDNEGNETNQVFNNVWIAARVQHDIDVMSTAIAEGTHLKSLSISIAEESNLMEDVDYAIQNITTKEYLTNGNLSYSQMAGDAARYQIKWTGRDDLTYTDTDGGLHHSFYIKVQSAEDWKWLVLEQSGYTTTDDEEQATAFLYSENSKKVQPIENKNQPGVAWSINANDTWLWDFFANFSVKVSGNNQGGLSYTKGSEQQTAINGQYIWLPAGVALLGLSNTSKPGYSASITKSDIFITVDYIQLQSGFYTFTDKGTDTPTTFYYDAESRDDANGCLSTYPAGERTLWDEKGDCSLWTIANETGINVNLSQNRNGSDEYFYGTLYSPVALVVPDGVKAYVAQVSEEDGTKLLLRRLCAAGEVLPKFTPVILYSEEAGTNTLPKTFAVASEDPTFDNTSNALTGVVYTYDRGSQKIYSLGRTKGIGFYNYTGAKVQAFKAFMLDEVASQVSAFYFVFDESGLTGVAGLEATQAKTAPYYDLSGRMIQRPASRGIYLQSGRKMLTK